MAETQNRAAILTNIGSAYSALKQHNQAIKCYKQVLIICEKLKISFGIAMATSNLGAEYVTLKKYDLGYNYLIRGMKIALENGMNNLLGQIYRRLSDVYLVRNQKKMAVEYLNKSLQVAKKVNDQNSILLANENLYKTYEQFKDFEKAFYASKEFIKLKDTIYGKEKQQIIQETAVKYETEKKEAAIKLLNQKNKIAQLESNRKSSVLWILALFFIGISTTAYVLFTRFKERKKTEILQTQLTEAQKLLEAEKKVTESELKALKSQMNPHFIFNALNSIQSQFMFGDKLLANEQLSNFTYLTRQILEVSGKKQIAISEEVDILTKYLELEKMRFQSDFDYSIAFSKNIDEDYHKIPPMLLQPLVENSIKHGLLHKKGSKSVRIYFDLDSQETHLLCSVTDNGIGRKKSAAIKAKSRIIHNSFSTQAITERLELLNVKLNLEDLVIYEDVVNEQMEIDGTKVIVKIPLV